MSSMRTPDDDSAPAPLDGGTALSELTVRDLRRAFRGALEDVLDDKARQDAYWRRGYEEFTRHAQADGASWLWKRTISAIGGALLACGLYLGFKFGGWGK